MGSIEKLTVVAALGLAPWIGACGDDETEETCRSYTELTPGGSFETDVMPLLSRSCALAISCHQGDPGSGQEGLGLGPNMDTDLVPTELDNIHDQLLNNPAVRSPLPHIQAGDPVGSWLMAKMEYDTANLAVCATCDGDCGVFMPQGSKPDSGLSRAERDTIAAWILDGAKR